MKGWGDGLVSRGLGAVIGARIAEVSAYPEDMEFLAKLEVKSSLLMKQKVRGAWAEYKICLRSLVRLY